MAHTHSEGHSHHHGHDHSHVQELSHIGRAFYMGISLNFIFVLIEVIVGLSVNSLSLLSDAGHNLADVASLALSLLAFKLLKVKPSDKYTYGYRKTTILVALFNAIILLISIGAIGYEAVRRIIHPEVLSGDKVAWVAAAGILINGITAFLFLNDKEKDINIKSAYLHMLADALVSVAIVIGGVVIFYTHIYWIDTVLSIVIVVVILKSTWGLLKSSLRLSLDGVPENVDLEKIRQKVMQLEEVKDIHHIHAWGLSTTINALTAHVLVNANMSITDLDILKKEIKHRLEHLNIQHATLEFEQDMHDCDNIEV